MTTDPTWILNPARRGNGVFRLTSEYRRPGRKPIRSCSATVERLDETTTRVWFQAPEGKSHATAIATAHDFASSVWAFVGETDDEVEAGNIDQPVEASAVVRQGLDKGGATVFVDVTHERGLAGVVVGTYFCDELTELMS